MEERRIAREEKEARELELQHMMKVCETVLHQYFLCIIAVQRGDIVEDAEVLGSISGPVKSDTVPLRCIIEAVLPRC